MTWMTKEEFCGLTPDDRNSALRGKWNGNKGTGKLPGVCSGQEE